MSLVGRCRLLYEFTAENDSELSVPEDSVVEILEARDDGWVLATFQGKLGLVPESYVERIEDDGEIIPSSPLASPSGDRSKEKDKVRDKEKKRDKDKQKDRSKDKDKDKDRESKSRSSRDPREKESKETSSDKEREKDKEKRKLDSEKVARRRSGELKTTDSVVRANSEGVKSNSASRFKTLSSAKMKQELQKVAQEESAPPQVQSQPVSPTTPTAQFAPPSSTPNSPNAQKFLPSIPKRAVSGILPKIPPKPVRPSGMSWIRFVRPRVGSLQFALGSPPPVPAKTLRPKSGFNDPQHAPASPTDSPIQSPARNSGPTLVRSSSMRGNDRPVDVGPFVPDPERDQQRFYIVKELVTTEKSYVAGLKETIDKYYKPMLQLAQSKSDPALTVEDLRLIFSQLENILPLNQNLLQSMHFGSTNFRGPVPTYIPHRARGTHSCLESDSDHRRCFRQICTIFEDVHDV